MKVKLISMIFWMYIMSGMSLVFGRAGAQGDYDGMQNGTKTLQALGRVKVKNSGEIKNSPWGIQAGCLDEDVLESASKIGVKWTRLQASWADIEHDSGSYDWSPTDIAFKSITTKNIIPFICISGANKYYCPKSGVADEKQKEIYGNHRMPPTSSPEAMKGWLRFVDTLIHRYKSTITYWEIWNEPNHFAYWGDSPNAAQYGRLVNETARLIKSIDTKAIILAGALAGLDPEYTDAFLKGNEDVVDILTFHNYGNIPEDRIYNAIETWDVLRKHNTKIQLWQGECGFPSHSSTRDFRGNGPWGYNIQAKWLLRQAFTDVFFCRTSMSNYFKLAHLGGRGEMPKRSFLTSIDSVLGFRARGGSRVKSVGVNEKCLLENPGLTPKPGYFTYQNLCSVFDNRYTIYPASTKIDICSQGVFYGLGKEDDSFPSVPLVATFRAESGNGFVAYWLPWPLQEIINPATVDLEVKDLRFHNPVLVDLMSGNVFPVELTKQDGLTIFKNIPLADYPFAIAELSEIELEKSK